MSEDETMINCNALKPERSRTFLEIVVSYPVFCAYPEYEGKPYYAIKYEEKDEIIIGFGTYKPEVLSQYLREYFLPFAEPERTVKVRDIVHTHGYPDEGLCGNCNEDVNGLYDYCPNCGVKLEWSGDE